MLIYLIAGEPSGDLLGGRLMAGLKALLGDKVRFAGIGGPAMTAQGLDSLFPMAELTVMGLTEVLPRIPRILRRVRQTLDHIGRQSPAAVITIDSWGFGGRVQKGLKARFPEIARVHYVAPMVWAWKPKRAAELAGVLDLLLTLLPFEPPYFERHGLRAEHVGHPVIECGAESGDGRAFRARHGIGADQPVLVVLPGSRRSEIAQLLPVFAATLTDLAASRPDLRVVVPAVDHLVGTITSAVAAWPGRPLVIPGAAERYDAFAAGTCALAASGTVSLELAMAGLPSVIAYRLSPLTALIARRLFGFSIKWASLVNMVMDRAVMPEFLQEECTHGQIAPAVARLLDQPDLRAHARADMAEAMARLGQGGPSPSQRAARVVVDFISERTRS